MFPIFFSVSHKNVLLAEEIWEQLPGDWVYIYSRTGEEGAQILDEISRRELPQSQLVVVFWSRHYARSEGCVREILQAKDLVQQRLLRSLVLRLDDFPIVWEAGLGEATKPVFDALGTMLDYRTSGPNVTVQRATALVQRLAEPILRSDHPRMQRLELQQTLREGI